MILVFVDFSGEKSIYENFYCVVCVSKGNYRGGVREGFEYGVS